MATESYGQLVTELRKLRLPAIAIPSKQFPVICLMLIF